MASGLANSAFSQASSTTSPAIASRQARAEPGRHGPGRQLERARIERLAFGKDITASEVIERPPSRQGDHQHHGDPASAAALTPSSPLRTNASIPAMITKAATTAAAHSGSDDPAAGQNPRPLPMLRRGRARSAPR